jgi:hypothetical protein
MSLLFQKCFAIHDKDAQDALIKCLHSYFLSHFCLASVVAFLDLGVAMWLGYSQQEVEKQ